MKTRICTLLIAISITACSSVGTFRIDPDIKPVLEELEAESGMKLWVNTYPIMFDYTGELKPNRNGLCRLYEKKNQAIKLVIRKEIWDSFDLDSKKALLAHELMHCTFFIGHVKDPRLEYDSLMSHYTSGSVRCIKSFGVKFCIEEAFYQLKHKQLYDLYLKNGSCDHHNH